jgi:hypothetical protein
MLPSELFVCGEVDGDAFKFLPLFPLLQKISIGFDESILKLLNEFITPFVL